MLDACSLSIRDISVAGESDVGSLNNLLGAEYALIKAYVVGIPILNMPTVGDPLAASGPILGAIATNWQNQHREHAAQLRTAITAIGGTPIAESTVTFTTPTEFTPTVRNVMVLACNAEKAAAIAYNQAVKAMDSASSRYLATIIEGAETQHFVILYTLLKQVIAPNGAMIITMIDEVVPKAFVADVGGMSNGLQSLAALTFSG